MPAATSPDWPKSTNELGLPTFDQYAIPDPTDYRALLEQARERRRRADDEAIIALLLNQLEGDEDGGGERTDDTAGL